MNTHKKWVQKSLFTFIFLLITIAIVNYKIDSLGLYGNSSFLEKAAKAIAENKIVTGVKNLDFRQLQSLVIKNLNTKTDVMIVGSSRSMNIKKEFLLYENISFFNHSMPGASLEDYIAIIGAYKKIHGYIPKTIILGTDPWIFNQHNGQTRYKTLSEYYNYMITQLPVKQNLQVNDTISSNKYKQLINFEYTKANFSFLRNYIKNGMKAFDIEEHKYIQTDKREIYHRKEHTLNIKSVNAKAIRYTQGDVYSLGMFKELHNTKLFEKFVKYLKGNGSNVILFLSPYHPIVYDTLTNSPKYEIINETEKYLNSFSKKHSLEIYGSFNPHKYNFIDIDFIDGMHSHNYVSQKIFENFRYNK